MCVPWLFQTLLLSISSFRTFAVLLYHIRHKHGLPWLYTEWFRIVPPYVTWATSRHSWLLIYWFIAGWHVVNRLVIDLWLDAPQVSAHSAVRATPPLPPTFTHQRWLCSWLSCVLSWNWAFIQVVSDNVWSNAVSNPRDLGTVEALYLFMFDCCLWPEHHAM